MTPLHQLRTFLSLIIYRQYEIIEQLWWLVDLFVLDIFHYAQV